MTYCKFLDRYVYYTQGNETPELFHVWTGLSVLAGAAEKRIWLDRGYFKLFLNLYIILISPAGTCSKSSSLDLGAKMLRDAGYTVLEGSVLKEKIIVEMSSSMKEYKIDDSSTFPHSSVTYSSDELNVLLSSGLDMVKFLVDIYSKDEAYVYKTKNSGEYEITNPYFNLISAAVPQWFGPGLATDMGATGFLARCILVYLDRKRGCFPEPILTKEQINARQECLEILMSLSELYGPMKVEEDARNFFNAWYREQYILPTEDYRIASYLERKTKVHLLKVASLMALGDLRYSVTIKDFERAMKLFERTEKTMRMAFLIAGGNKLSQYIFRVQTILDSNEDGILVKDLLHMFYVDIDENEFRQIIQTLVDMEYAKLEIEEKKRKILKKIKHNGG